MPKPSDDNPYFYLFKRQQQERLRKEWAAKVTDNETEEVMIFKTWEDYINWKRTHD